MGAKAVTLAQNVRFACPACGGAVTADTMELSCDACGRTYALENEIPQLVANADAAKDAQATWFDAATSEWEIDRPHGAPRLYSWVLEERFRRAVAGLDLVGASALAVCAGSGMDAEFLARAGARVVAADISPGAARRAAERASRRALDLVPVVADAERLPFADRSFDVVYVHDGLHHLERPLAALAEMARVARHTVCVTEPARAALTGVAVKLGLAEEREEAGNRVARLSLPEVEDVLREHGYSIVVAERYGMLYRHEPGWAMALCSLPGAFTLSRAVVRAGNAVAGRLGNKLVVVAGRA